MRKYKLETITSFKDKYTKEIYSIGQELNVNEERAIELLSSPHNFVKFISCEGEDSEALENLAKENEELKINLETLIKENEELKEKVEKELETNTQDPKKQNK